MNGVSGAANSATTGIQISKLYLSIKTPKSPPKGAKLN